MNKHFLLVDDDNDERDIFFEALQQTGISFKLSFLTDPECAIRQLYQISPDYIFVDFNMPKMNGIECLKEIKKNPLYHNMSVVLYSTFTDNLVKQALDAGAMYCLKKTNEIGTLSKALKNIVMYNEIHDSAYTA